MNVVLKLWSNGFSVDDGPVRDFHDPGNKEFLDSVRKGCAALFSQTRLRRRGAAATCCVHCCVVCSLLALNCKLATLFYEDGERATCGSKGWKNQKPTFLTESNTFCTDYTVLPAGKVAFLQLINTLPVNSSISPVLGPLLQDGYSLLFVHRGSKPVDP